LIAIGTAEGKRRVPRTGRWVLIGNG